MIFFFECIFFLMIFFSFDNQILAFECIPALKARLREGVEGCMSKCPRMCKKRFQSNSMKGYPLEDLYDTLGEIKVRVTCCFVFIK